LKSKILANKMTLYNQNSLNSTNGLIPQLVLCCTYQELCNRRYVAQSLEIDFATGSIIQGIQATNDPVHWDCDNVPDNRSMTVQAFQRLYNRNNPKRSIGEDGRVGADTLRALANSPACGFENASIPRWLSLGATGKDVAKYQLILRDMKLYKGAYDGIFGSGLQKAVIDFQTRYKLDVMGIVGDRTSGRLCDYPDIEIPA
jgi:Putative peptidoglycan binding domain